MATHATDNDLWIFGYGSLMWRPGFEYQERIQATLNGYHRALCILSVHHRGSVERPGLVLGLDKGGSCRGIAFRVADQHAEATLAYLREREQVTSVYLETHHRSRRAAVTFALAGYYPRSADRAGQGQRSHSNKSEMLLADPCEKMGNHALDPLKLCEQGSKTCHVS